MDKEEWTVEQRLAVIERAEGRTFDLFKWGFATFTTLALLFIGFNWWSAKTNYDRDKDVLKQQSEILEKRLAFAQEQLQLANQNRLESIRRENEFSLLSISNSLRYDYWKFEQTSWSNYSVFIATITNSMTQYGSNFNAMYEQSFSNVYTSVNEQLSNSIAHLGNRVDNANRKIEASALLSEANSLLNKGRRSNMDLQKAVAYLLESASYSLESNEQNNLRVALEAATDNAIPALIKSTTPAVRSYLEGAFPIQEDMTHLIALLEQADTNHLYPLFVSFLKYQQEVLTGKTKPARKFLWIEY